MRSNTEETDALVRRLLAAHLVLGVEAPPNYSLRLAEPTSNGNSSSRELNLLYQSHGMAARARSSRSVLESLVSYLSTDAQPAQELLLSTALGLVRGDQAVLAPRGLLEHLDRFQPHLRRSGLTIVDALVSSIDPATGELVVLPWALTVDHGVLAGAEDDGGGKRAAAPVASGRYPIRTWAFDLGLEQGGPLPKAMGLVYAQSTVNRQTFGAQATLVALTRVFSSAGPVGVSYELPSRLVSQLLA